jgi:hypothetical protein
LEFGHLATEAGGLGFDWCKELSGGAVDLFAEVKHGSLGFLAALLDLVPQAGKLTAHGCGFVERKLTRNGLNEFRGLDCLGASLKRVRLDCDIALRDVLD